MGEYNQCHCPNIRQTNRQTNNKTSVTIDSTHIIAIIQNTSIKIRHTKLMYKSAI